MLREVIRIDTEKCDGCGNCITNCYEGALQMIDNKAVLVSELLCDGLGACLGHCATGALKIEKQEVQPYSEIEVIKNMSLKGKKVVIAHLKHLKDHKELVLLNEGLDYLEQRRNELPFDLGEINMEMSVGAIKKELSGFASINTKGLSFPGTRSVEFEKKENAVTGKLQDETENASALTHWPIQLHLIQPGAAHFRNADLLLSADCVAYSFGQFHSNYLKDRKLAIACPKLDSNKEIYKEKLVSLIEDALINTITVIIMEVPCCGGLLQIAKQATSLASRKVPLKAICISTQGKVLSEEWI